MKKNISINLQGMIFHIEEDGYEVLRTYLDSIKIYFSGYAGHQEIIADIESRMAEIFYANLTPTKQVITLEDVQALIKKMGSVNDFAQHDKDEDEVEVEAPKMIGSTTSGSYSSGSGSAATGSAAYTGTKRLYRDGNRKVISGVAAGIAAYLNTEPLWVRLTLLFLVIVIAPITAGLSAGFIILLYILCWIALPINYDTPVGNHAYSATETTSRKLFRNPDDKKLGGVCSGLALYLGIDPAMMRLIFLIGLFAGGASLLIYVLLWIVLPEAKTITEKAQMQGKPLTLSGIENSLKNSLQPDGANQEESPLVRLMLLPVRLLSQILVVLSRILGPVINALLVVVRIFAGVMLIIMGISGIIALVSLLLVSTGVIQDASFIELNNVPNNFFFTDFPLFGKIAGFLAGLIPALFLIILGLGLLTKRFYMRATVGWTMFAVMLISGFIFLASIISYSKNFEENGTYVTEKTFPAANYQTISLDANKIERVFDDYIDVTVESYAGNDIRLIQQFSAEGRTEEDAIKNAQMMNYRAVLKDSMLVLDNGFTFKQNAIFREQELALKLRLPEGKTYRISYDMARLLPESNFDLNYSNEQISKHGWKIKNNVFTCVTCTAADSAEVTDRTDAGFDPDFDNSGEKSFLKTADDFGPSVRQLDAANFKKISVVGPFYVKIIPGQAFNVKARGDADDLREMRFEVENGELSIFPRKSGFSLGRNNPDPIYITVQMPDLMELSLVGASTAEVVGFKQNKLKVNQTGATQAFIRTDVQTLEINLTGASEAVLEGTARDLEADVVGGCELNALKLIAENANLDVTGGSEAHVNVQRILRGDVTGGSELTYTGDPENIKVDEGGGSDVNRREI
ncbi:PspC domain-containing protein [Adhaeribacter sp. BT258]|uniref:PspC domain-containing protein n=1 Tax=Adhaeribacter terrigena TaxID=2793070 RepID=A0ABS1C5C0_9BACT|nr:PspC domain-containing protein [Adhaeribacter terrigena]MBK0404590.1 PspC domain-containing protein [Adhaeribacter terrigena]